VAIGYPDLSETCMIGGFSDRSADGLSLNGGVADLAGVWFAAAPAGVWEMSRDPAVHRQGPRPRPCDGRTARRGQTALKPKPLTPQGMQREAEFYWAL
jgi:hypothetical protein